MTGKEFMPMFVLMPIALLFLFISGVAVVFAGADIHGILGFIVSALGALWWIGGSVLYVCALNEAHEAWWNRRD